MYPPLADLAAPRPRSGIHAPANPVNARVHLRPRLRKSLAPLAFCFWQLASHAPAAAQTYDLGYVPIGATNTVGGFNFAGGSYNGTNFFMAAEAMIGPNAADFSTSTNYA